MNPETIKLAVIAAIAAALLAVGAAAGWTLNGWRLSGELERTARDRDTYVQQSQILAAGVKACNAGVDQAKRMGDLALEQIRGHLVELKRLHAGNQEAVDRIEELIKKPTPIGAGCEKAWDELEAQQKAGAPR